MNQFMNEEQRQVFAENYYEPHKRAPRPTGGKRDLIYCGIVLILSIMCVNFLFYGSCGIAFAVVAVGILTVTLLYLRPQHRSGGVYMGFCTLAYVLCALSLALSDSGLAAFLSICIMLVLSGIILMDYMSLRRGRKGVLRSVEDWGYTVFVLPFANLGSMVYAIFRKKNEDGTVEKRKINSILIGIVCALPVLLMVVPLLMGADYAFEGLIDELTMDVATELPVTLFVGVGLFFPLFGQLWSAKVSEPGTQQQETGKKGIDTIFLTTFLSAIAVVYVLYLVSQMAYFFNAFAGLLPEDFTVAQYARRGFFEMTAVCVINLGLLFFALFTAKKKENGKEPSVIRILALFLCLFSLVLVATAMSKMNLYIQSFGMTYLRILTSVFMIFLCVVFCTMGLWIFLRKLPYMQVFVITATVLILGVSFADPARVVAGYNVNAYLTGKLDSVDMTELQFLGSDAVVPYVWELRNDPDNEVCRKAWGIIYDHGLDYGFFENGGEEYSYDWRDFNLSSYRAYRLILENRDEIYSEACRHGHASYDRFD